MAIIGWGKPRIFYKELGSKTAVWKEFDTPVESSTSLATTKGDKTEAKVEGGANEAVKYAKNTYALTFNIRAAKDRQRPIDDEDGVISTGYAIALQPEAVEAPGFVMEASTASVEDSYSSADGGVWAYTFDALVPEQSGFEKKKQVQWGTIKVGGTKDNYTITFDDDIEVAPNPA